VADRDKQGNHTIRSDFETYRMIEHYGRITNQRGVVAPPEPSREDR
jgi:hypothetical protein